MEQELLDINEADLVAALRSGSESAFRRLVLQYERQVRQVCFGFLRNQEDAEDVAQEVFMEVYRSVGKFRGDARLSTWLYRIAVSRSLNQVKRNQKRMQDQSLEGTSAEGQVRSLQIADAGMNPQAALENDERNRILMQAVDKLPKNQRVAFTLHRFDELSYKEIAAIMEVSLSSVESLMHRAKRNLKKRLMHYYKK